MTRSARAISRASQSAAAARRDSVTLARCARSASQSEPGRPCARANSSSSVSPTSGLFSSAASWRSSSGSSSTSASASRSCTAICSTRAMRSAPPTGTLRSFSARTRRGTKAPVRRRTRIRMSPGRMARPRAGRGSPSRSQRAMRAASASANSASGPAACCGGVSGTSQGVGGSISPASSSGHSSTAPAWPRRSERWVRRASPSTTPARAAPAAKTASTRASTGAVERNETLSCTSRSSSPSAAQARPKCARQVAKPVASAPWKP